MLLWGASIIDLFATKIGLIAIIALLYIMFTWYYVLDEIDKNIIISAMGKWPSVFRVVCRR